MPSSFKYNLAHNSLNDRTHRLSISLLASLYQCLYWCHFTHLLLSNAHHTAHTNNQFTTYHNTKSGAALCVRCGEIYFELIEELQSARNARIISDRPILERRAWADFNSKRLKPVCHGSYPIAISELQEFMQRAEITIEIATLQIARYAEAQLQYIDRGIVEDNLSEVVTVELLKSFARQLGLKNISGSMLTTILIRALMYNNEHTSAECTFKTLYKYCEAFATSLQPADDEARGVGLHGSTNKHRLLPFYESTNVSKNIVSLAWKIPRTKSGCIERDAFVASVVQRQHLAGPIEFIACLGELLEVRLGYIHFENIIKFCYPFGLTVRLRSNCGTFYIRDNFTPTDSTHQLYQLISTNMFNKLRQSPRITADANIRIPNDIMITMDKRKTRIILRSKKTIVSSYLRHGDTLWVWSEYVDSILELYSEGFAERLKAEKARNALLDEERALTEKVSSTPIPEKDNNGKNKSQMVKKNQKSVERKNKVQSTIHSQPQQQSPEKTRIPTNTESELLGKTENSLSAPVKAGINKDSLLSSNKNKETHAAAGSEPQTHTSVATVGTSHDTHTVSAVETSRRCTYKTHSQSGNNASSVHWLETEAHLWTIPMVVKYVIEEMELQNYEGNLKRCEITGYEFIRFVCTLP